MKDGNDSFQDKNTYCSLRWIGFKGIKQFGDYGSMTQTVVGNVAW